MKPIPQFEFRIADEPFALVPEKSLDGDRVTRERAQATTDRAASDLLQLQVGSSRCDDRPGV